MANNKYSYDVVIIGGGPAGSSAAFFLAQNGIKTLVIEKEKLPRYKTCGGGIVSRVKNILPFVLDDIIENECCEAEVYDKGSGRHFISKSRSPIIMMTMRQNLDYFILSKAIELGAVLYDGSEVKNLAQCENKIEIKTGTDKITAKFVIAADGASGITSKILKTNNCFVKLPALEYEVYPGRKIYSKFNGKARFDFGIPDDGYGWVFPKKDHLSIGIISMSKSHVNLNNTYAQYLSSLGLGSINKLEKHGYYIPISKRNNLIFNKRILFAGDSAGLADPLFGEGISNALLSGKFAAESIINADFNEDKTSYLYNKAVTGSISIENKYAGIIAYFTYNFPAVRTFLFRYYGQTLSEIIAEIFAGKRKYSALVKSPKSYFKLLIYYLTGKKQIFENGQNSSVQLNHISNF